MKWLLILAVCFSPTLALAKPLSKWQAPKTRVVVKPGECVGELKIGMNTHEAHMAIGQPTRTYFNWRNHEVSSEIWCEGFDSRGQIDITNPSTYFVAAFFVKGHVTNIAAKLPKTELSDGFPLDSGFKQITSKFSGLKYDSLIPDEDLESDGYQDTKLGIAFFYGVFDCSTQSRMMKPDETPQYFEVFRRNGSMSHLSGWNWLD